MHGIARSALLPAIPLRDVATATGGCQLILLFGY